MIKILKAPLQLEPFLDEFKDLFTKPSYRSFRDLCAALSVCDKSKTVANLYSLRFTTDFNACKIEVPCNIR